MRRVLVLGGLAAAAGAYWFQRRTKAETEPSFGGGEFGGDVQSPATPSTSFGGEVSSPSAPTREVVFEPAPEPPPFAGERGAVPGPEHRDDESETTEETRYHRLVEQESEERHDAAERVRDDPLTRRLEDEY